MCGGSDLIGLRYSPDAVFVFVLFFKLSRWVLGSHGEEGLHVKLSCLSAVLCLCFIHSAAQDRV